MLREYLARIGVPVGGEDDDAAVPQQGPEELQVAQRFLVSPVQVVDHDQQRLLGGQERLCQRVEQAELIVVGGGLG
ncbi:hypothetical protein LWC34_39110 [Kibdelosporangium philippinense]|uniref:Uncharacterized protein n=1 Tax=Kibdelosporangium philippinense TaxID=211113 RepID=A0ABS8ZLZ1_9PSEU|nr:hypothetical protein [Kibdelosporangium philippinense]MCE7008779.1 hypothetical protein [Kibdelosporangium philippinense]